MEFNLVFDRKKKCKTKTDKGVIELRAYNNKITKYFTTKIFITKSEWNPSEKKITSKNNDHEQLNRVLITLLQGLKDEKFDKGRKGQNFGFDDISYYIKRRTNKTSSYIEFVLNELDQDLSLSVKTKRQHKNTLIKLKAFAQKDVMFPDLTYDFFDRFFNYLRLNKYQPNTIHKHQKNLKKYIELAIKKEYTDIKNYCKEIKNKTEQKPREVITIQEIDRLRNLKLIEHETKLKQVRDMFLFACYTGLRISDVTSIKLNYIKAVDKGLMLDFYTKKVNKHAQIPLYILFPNNDVQTYPEQIISLYYKEGNEFLFPKLSEPFINRHLKELAERAGIKVNLTFHVARESFGTIMANKVSIPILKLLLQHSDIRTTQRYIHHNFKNVEEQLTKVSDWQN